MQKIKHHLKIEENFVKFGDLYFLLLVKLIDRYCLNGRLIVIEKEKAESHDIDQHVLLHRGEVFLLLVHDEAHVDDVAEKILKVLDFSQRNLQLLPDQKT